MKVFEYESIAESYAGVLQYVLENGEEVSPRGQLTKEITPAAIVIRNPRKRAIDHPVRKLNYGFMVGELLWILQGKNDLSITHYNKQWANFSDDGQILNGAYGQRIFNWDGGDTIAQDEETGKVGYYKIRINQFMEVYKRLQADTDSRQGSITLFDPSKDFAQTKDVPCTNLMRFSIRNGKLNMMVVMRSNDLWFGYPYDVYNFTMLQEIMAGLLGVEVGKYTHVADSLHLYEMHFNAARELIATPHETKYAEFTPLDMRLSEEELDITSNQVFNVEHATRETIESITVEEVAARLNVIPNEGWRSIAGVIATYNFKKAKRSESEINTLRSFITNEFNGLV
jgi:thymidylate synthase